MLIALNVYEDKFYISIKHFASLGINLLWCNSKKCVYLLRDDLILLEEYENIKCVTMQM